MVKDPMTLHDTESKNHAWDSFRSSRFSQRGPQLHSLRPLLQRGSQSFLSFVPFRYAFTETVGLHSNRPTSFEEVLFKKVLVQLKWFLVICKKTSTEMLSLPNLILMVTSNCKQGKKLCLH